MKKFTVMVVAPDAKQTLQLNLPQVLVHTVAGVSVLLSFLIGYLSLDYMQLRDLRQAYFDVVVENNHIKGEAKILGNHLDEVKTSLKKIESYSIKLEEMMQVTTDKFAHKTGVGPLNAKETEIRNSHLAVDKPSANKIPLGIDIQQLTFKPIFEKLGMISNTTETQTLQLQTLLSSLAERRSLLTSVPSASPLLAGWVTSRFGSRVSPFTGDIGQHKGIDIAGAIGTPIYAPADGVVVFVGAKEGYGNFIMLAHGFGVVSGYGHNSQNLVSPGQVVKRGDQIATVGQTGRTTGPHLHYEIWVNGKTANPEKFILNIEELGVY